MILTKLKEYAENRMGDNLPPPMYGKTSIAWYIRLSAKGEYEGLVSLKTKELKRGQLTIAPHIGRTAGVKPKLLADTGEYVLGVGRASSKPDRVNDCHTQFKQLIEKCFQATQQPEVQAILHFLSTEELEKAKADLSKDFDPGEVITFAFSDSVPADAAYKFHLIEDFWAKYTSGEVSEGSNDKSTTMTCLITGDVGIVEKRLPFLVKGIIGGQPSGTALVSANSPPFMSYGLQNSLTSPISRDAAEKFTKALNSLIANEQSRIYIGSTVYVFWTKKETNTNYLPLLNKPKLEDVKILLESPFTAKKASNLGDDKVNQFYALSLNANNARAVVRDWLETTVSNVESNLREWFQRQQMIEAWGKEQRWFSVGKLADHLYRRDSKTDRSAEDIQASVLTALIRNALHGDRIPEDLLVKLVRRNRVEHEVTYPRAVLLKLIFSSNSNRQEMMTNMEQLNLNPNLEGNDRVAYFCGRLLAVLETIQRSAIGSVNAPLTDRYYGAASSTPAVAFSQLLRGARAHFSKLRKEKIGTCKALEEQVEEIAANISTFPKTLNLQQQGLFGLGYYHQRASDRASAKAKSEARKLEQATAS
jgi:CRISPR-associated protein Csd1